MKNKAQWRELLRLERVDARLFGKCRLPQEHKGKQPLGRHLRVESARAVVRERILALRALLETPAVPFVDVDTETVVDHSTRLSFQIRVF